MESHMRVWLITIGEPLPIDGLEERLLRSGILAESLSRSGHHVVWWTSAFDHVRKQHRVPVDTIVTTDAGYRLRLLHSVGYRSNLSLRRIVNHRGVARKFRNLALHEPRPDIILCSWPTLELCVEAVRLGQWRGTPVVLDVRDMWPDAIADLAPSMLRPMARFALRSSYRNAREAAGGATAITGITDRVVDWAMPFTGRTRSPLDRAFPMAYLANPFSLESATKAVDFWRSFGLLAGKPRFIACFFGTIGRHFEIETIVEAARHLHRSGRDIVFVLCCDGPELSHWRKLATDCPNVILPGWVDAAKIRCLMGLSSVGLAPYYSSWDFKLSIPNKPIEYLSGHLPIVSSLQGVLAELLAENECGLTHGNGSAKDLERVLAQCYDHPVKLARMAANAGRLYRKQFNADVVYTEMQDYLIEIAHAKRQIRAA